MIKESIKEIAAHPAPLFARYFAIEAVFLVGSHAEGRTRPNSDLDLALRDPRAQLGAHTIDVLAALTHIGLMRFSCVGGP